MNSHPTPSISNFIKKRRKIQEGGLGQNPRKKNIEPTKTDKREEEPK